VSPQRPDKTRVEEIRRIRSELDKRTPDQVAKAERGARKAVDRNARDDQEKGSFLGQIFGRKK
jgi:hypothetical protein